MGVFERIQNFNFLKKHPKLFCSYLSNQISLRDRFVFKTDLLTDKQVNRQADRQTGRQADSEAVMAGR